MSFDHTNLPIESLLPKLVRGKIPNQIRINDHKEPRYHKAKNDKEFLKYAMKKLIEESTEIVNYKNKNNLTEELADLKEVIISICKIFDIKDTDIEKFRLAKKSANGGFEDKLILEAK